MQLQRLAINVQLQLFEKYGLYTVYMYLKAEITGIQTISLEALE